MEVIIDCLGEICPVPVIKAQIQYKKTKDGGSFSILTDHSCTCQNLKDAFMNVKCTIDVDEIETGIWKILIIKGKNLAGH